MKFIAQILILLLLVQLALSTDHVYKLAQDDSKNDSSKPTKSPSSSSSTSDDQKLKTVTGKVGDVVVFDLPADKEEGSNAGLMEWVFLEGMMGREGDIYRLQSESMKINDDGSRVYSFGFKILKEGEDVLSFVNGDISKLDDAIDNFKENSDEIFSVADMKGSSYA